MASKDYYKTLGVDKGASKDEVKKAYHKLAKEYHPDINKTAQAAQKMKEITEAYEILSDSKKRSNYDNFGSADGFDHNGFSQGFGGGFSYEDFDGFESFFGDIFGFSSGGGRGPKRHAQDGRDVEFRVSLKLEQAFKGHVQEVKYKIKSDCSGCKGNGFQGQLRTCAACNGSGMRTVRTGVMSFSATNCNTCKGQGKIGSPCNSCHGVGKVETPMNIKFNIPSGVSKGDVLKQKGLGHPGSNGGKNGDLTMQIEIEHHDIYEKKGSELYISYKVTLSQIIMGGEVRLKDLDETYFSFSIPAGQSPTAELLIPDRGYYSSVNSKKRGNLHVKFQMDKVEVTDALKQMLLRSMPV